MLETNKPQVEVKPVELKWVLPYDWPENYPKYFTYDPRFETTKNTN